jgi:hypothetical protein
MKNDLSEDKEPGLEEIFSLDEDNDSTKVMPHCMVSVDYKNRVHLLSILNEDDTQVRKFLCSDFLEYFDDEIEVWGDKEPGLYVADFWINSWQDNNPDSCDWNAELVSYNVECLWKVSDKNSITPTPTKGKHVYP